jgi:hypothetical protein
MSRFGCVAYPPLAQPLKEVAAAIEDSPPRFHERRASTQAAHLRKRCLAQAYQALCRLCIKHQVIINFCHWPPAYDVNSPLKPGVAGIGAQFAKEVSGAKSRFNYTSQGPPRGARAEPYTLFSNGLYLPQIFVMVSRSRPNTSAALSMAAVTFAPALTFSHTCSAICVSRHVVPAVASTLTHNFNFAVLAFPCRSVVRVKQAG